MSIPVSSFISEAADSGTITDIIYGRGRNCNCHQSFCDQTDCSGLVQWLLCRLGCSVPRVSSDIYTYCRNRGLAITPTQALQTPGALVFHFSSNPTLGVRPSQAHVAIVIAPGLISECRSPGQPCVTGVSGKAGKYWNYGALVPCLDYSAQGVPQQSVSSSDGSVIISQPSSPTINIVPMGPPPRYPNPPTVSPSLVPSLPDWVQSFYDMIGCDETRVARLVRGPDGDGSIWLVNAFYRRRVTSAEFELIEANGLGSPIYSITHREFDPLLDVTSWPL